jgi:hypothetical protein
VVLSYYRFTGRFIGKSLMEQQNIPATLSLPLRKQILALPITFSDLEFVDEELFRNLRWLLTHLTPTQWPTHLLTHSLTGLLTHSLTYSLTHSLTWLG